MNDNLMTVKDAATYFNISERSVYTLIGIGLPSIKSAALGRRILRAQSDAWLLAGGHLKRANAAKSKKKSTASQH